MRCLLAKVNGFFSLCKFYWITFASVGLLAVRRIHGTFTCHICDKALKITTGFRSHLVNHGLKMTISDTSLPEPKNSLQDLEDVSDSMSPSEIIYHIPPEDLIIGNSPNLIRNVNYFHIHRLFLLQVILSQLKLKKKLINSWLQNLVDGCPLYMNVKANSMVF